MYVIVSENLSHFARCLFVAMKFKQPSLFCSVTLMVRSVLVSMPLLQMSTFEYCKPKQ